jgi:Ca-activated chloride channel family protein
MEKAIFRFAHQEYLWLLAVLPVIFILYILFVIARKRSVKRFGDPALIMELMPYASLARAHLKFVLVLISLGLIIVALAGPQFGSKIREVKRKGIEIIIGLDVSNSMMARDIEPNRLERSKQAISRLIDKLENDRLGLIVFAGDAYIQIPITNDYISAKMFLSGISTAMVTRQGTAIGSAIELATKSFGPNKDINKAIIIISDGENHEGNALEMARKAKEMGIKVFTIGIGQPEGVPIPDGEGDFTREYRRDRDGNIVTTKLNEQMLAEIAREGDGKYFRASSGNIGLNDLYAVLNKMEKSEIDAKEFSEYEEQFPFIIWIVLSLLIIDILIMERKNKWLQKIRILQ